MGLGGLHHRCLWVVIILHGSQSIPWPDSESSPKTTSKPTLAVSVRNTWLHLTWKTSRKHTLWAHHALATHWRIRVTIRPCGMVWRHRSVDAMRRKDTSPRKATDDLWQLWPPHSIRDREWTVRISPFAIGADIPSPLLDDMVVIAAKASLQSAAGVTKPAAHIVRTKCDDRLHPLRVLIQARSVLIVRIGGLQSRPIHGGRFRSLRVCCRIPPRWLAPMDGCNGLLHFACMIRHAIAG